MADNEANRDEALKCASIAMRALDEGDVAKAERFIQKSQRLYSCREVSIVAERIERVKSGASAANGGGASSTPQSPRSAAPSDGPSPAQPPSPPHTAATNGHSSHNHTHRHSTGTGAGPSSESARQHGDHPAGMGGSRRQPGEPVGVKKRTVHAHHSRTVHVEKTVDENAGTAEQRKLVADILKAKDFYETLGLARNCSDDDIKKAYRRLALKLHPDKNCAARSEEAFKQVSKAFSCLSDGDKRAYYDRTGFESTAAANAAAAAAHAQHTPRRTHGGPPGMYYTDDFDPEEIFNMFFGGGMQGQMFRAQFGMPRRRAAHAQQQQQQGAQRNGRADADRNPRQALLMGFMQFLPVILLLFFSLFSMFNSSIYSLSRDAQYRDQLHTSRLNVPYYVKSRHEFERSYPNRTSARVKVEHEIERDYYERLGQKCQQERLSKQRLMYSWSTRNEARNMRLPSCEEIDRINEKLNIPVRAY